MTNVGGPVIGEWRCCSGNIRWWPGARATVPTINADKLVTSDTVRQSLAIWLLEPPSRLPIPMSTQRTTSTSDSSSWGADFGGLFEKFCTSHHTPKNVLGLKIFYFKNKRRRSSIIFWWIVSQSAKVCLWSPSSCSKPQMIGCTPISTPMVAKPHKSHTCDVAEPFSDPQLYRIFDIHPKSCWWLTIFDIHAISCWWLTIFDSF